MTTPPLVLNPLATVDQLEACPSRKDGLPLDLILDLRCYGAQFIHRLGQLLSCPQRVTGTAQVLFQRFWFVTSFRDFSCLQVAAATIYLAAKLEEWTVRVREIVNCWDFLIQRDRWAARRARSSSQGCPWITSEQRQEDQVEENDATKDFRYRPHSYQSETFFDFKDSLVVHEMQLLKRLGFQLQVQLPYSTLVNYLNILGVGKDPEVVQRCWSFCSDMLQTPLPALFPPHILSLASIYFLSLLPSSTLPPLPQTPHPWYYLFEVVSLEELCIVCSWLKMLYDRQDGIASRVREDWGGLVELKGKYEVRKWLEERQQQQNRDGEGQRDKDDSSRASQNVN